MFKNCLRTQATGFGSVRVLDVIFAFEFWFGSVLSKMRVLVRFVRFRFGSIRFSSPVLMLAPNVNSLHNGILAGEGIE